MGESDIKILNKEENNVLRIVSPQTDISENEDFYFVRVDLPGVKRENINITIKNQILIIEGLKQKPESEKTHIFHRIEREFGVFRRTITFREKTDQNNIVAELQNGVLTIKIKKMKLNIKVEIK